MDQDVDSQNTALSTRTFTIFLPHSRTAKFGELLFTNKQVQTCILTHLTLTPAQSAHRLMQAHLQRDVADFAMGARI